MDAPFGALYAVVPPVAVDSVVVVATATGWWYAMPVDIIVSTYDFVATSVVKLG